jgi:hypothetical protein
MKFHYGFLWAVIFFEIALVFFIVIIAFVYKFYYSSKAAKIKLHTQELRDYLESLIQGKDTFSEGAIHSTWKKMEIVLPVILEFEAKEKAPLWEKTKKELVNTVLLPLAREGAEDRYWVTRMLAAQSFQFDTNLEDTRYIVKLLEDKIPLIHLHAAMAAIIDGNKDAIFRLIEIMAKYNHYSHAIYLQLFEPSYTYIPDFIQEFLALNQDPLIRWVCYEILIKYPPIHNLDSIDEDVKSDNQELQINAIKYYKYAMGEKAVPKLLELLNTQKWGARVICLHCLGSLKATSVIPDIEKCLHDHVWWVRTAAAQALKQMGDEGLAVLNEQSEEKDRYAYDAAMHALNKPPAPKKE